MKNSLAKILILVTIIFMDLLTGMEFDLFVPSFRCMWIGGTFSGLCRQRYPIDDLFWSVSELWRVTIAIRYGHREKSFRGDPS